MLSYEALSGSSAAALGSGLERWRPFTAAPLVLSASLEERQAFDARDPQAGFLAASLKVKASLKLVVDASAVRNASALVRIAEDLACLLWRGGRGGRSGPGQEGGGGGPGARGGETGGASGAGGETPAGRLWGAPDLYLLANETGHALDFVCQDSDSGGWGAPQHGAPAPGWGGNSGGASQEAGLGTDPALGGLPQGASSKRLAPGGTVSFGLGYSRGQGLGYRRVFGVAGSVVSVGLLQGGGEAGSATPSSTFDLGHLESLAPGQVYEATPQADPQAEPKPAGGGGGGVPRGLLFLRGEGSKALGGGARSTIVLRSRLLLHNHTDFALVALVSKPARRPRNGPPPGDRRRGGGGGSSASEVVTVVGPWQSQAVSWEAALGATELLLCPARVPGAHPLEERSEAPSGGEALHAALLAGMELPGSVHKRALRRGVAVDVAAFASPDAAAPTQVTRSIREVGLWNDLPPRTPPPAPPPPPPTPPSEPMVGCSPRDWRHLERARRAGWADDEALRPRLGSSASSVLSDEGAPFEALPAGGAEYSGLGSESESEDDAAAKVEIAVETMFTRAARAPSPPGTAGAMRGEQKACFSVVDVHVGAPLRVENTLPVALDLVWAPEESHGTGCGGEGGEGGEAGRREYRLRLGPAETVSVHESRLRFSAFCLETAAGDPGGESLWGGAQRGAERHATAPWTVALLQDGGGHLSLRMRPAPAATSSKTEPTAVAAVPVEPGLGEEAGGRLSRYAPLLLHLRLVEDDEGEEGARLPGAIYDGPVTVRVGCPCVWIDKSGLGLSLAQPSTGLGWAPATDASLPLPAEPRLAAAAAAAAAEPKAGAEGVGCAGLVSGPVPRLIALVPEGPDGAVLVGGARALHLTALADADATGLVTETTHWPIHVERAGQVGCFLAGAGAAGEGTFLSVVAVPRVLVSNRTPLNLAASLPSCLPARPNSHAADSAWKGAATEVLLAAGKDSPVHLGTALRFALLGHKAAKNEEGGPEKTAEKVVAWSLPVDLAEAAAACEWWGDLASEADLEAGLEPTDLSAEDRGGGGVRTEELGHPHGGFPPPKPLGAASYRPRIGESFSLDLLPVAGGRGDFSSRRVQVTVSPGGPAATLRVWLRLDDASAGGQGQAAAFPAPAAYPGRGWHPAAGLDTESDSESDSEPESGGSDRDAFDSKGVPGLSERGSNSGSFGLAEADGQRTEVVQSRPDGGRRLSLDLSVQEVEVEVLAPRPGHRSAWALVPARFRLGGAQGGGARRGRRTINSSPAAAVAAAAAAPPLLTLLAKGLSVGYRRDADGFDRRQRRRVGGGAATGPTTTGGGGDGGGGRDGGGSVFEERVVASGTATFAFCAEALAVKTNLPRGGGKADGLAPLTAPSPLAPMVLLEAVWRSQVATPTRRPGGRAQGGRAQGRRDGRAQGSTPLAVSRRGVAVERALVQVAPLDLRASDRLLWALVATQESFAAAARPPRPPHLPGAPDQALPPTPPAPSARVVLTVSDLRVSSLRLHLHYDKSDKSASNLRQSQGQSPVRGTTATAATAAAPASAGPVVGAFPAAALQGRDPDQHASAEPSPRRPRYPDTSLGRALRGLKVGLRGAAVEFQGVSLPQVWRGSPGELQAMLSAHYARQARRWTFTLLSAAAPKMRWNPFRPADPGAPAHGHLEPPQRAGSAPSGDAEDGRTRREAARQAAEQRRLRQLGL